MHNPNQELACLYNEPWANGIGRVFPGPKKDEIVTYEGVDPDNPECIYLKEYNFIAVSGRASYYSAHFVPIASITELTEILEQQEATA